MRKKKKSEITRGKAMPEYTGRNVNGQQDGILLPELFWDVCWAGKRIIVVLCRHHVSFRRVSCAQVRLLRGLLILR